MRALASVCLAAALAAACSRNPTVRKQKFYEHGNRLFDQGQYADAAIEYRNALAVDPRFGQARARLAETYKRLHDDKKAFLEYVRAADLLPDDVEVQLTAGNYLLLARRFEDAREKASRLLAKYPNDVRVHILLGNATAGLKDFDAAARDLEEAVQMAPNRADAYTNLGVLELADRKTDAAEAAFKKAIELSPTSVPARLALASFYWSQNRAADAAAVLKDGLAGAANDPSLNRALALSAFMNNRPADAEPYVRQLAHQATDAESRFALADYLNTMGRTDEAARELRDLAADKATFARATVRLAGIAFATGRPAEADQRLEEVLVRDPHNSAALVLRARLRLLERKYDEALASATTAVQADAESAQAHFVLGDIHRARGELDAARKDFTQALQINPRAAIAQLELGRIELLTGHAADAGTLATAALQVQPSNGNARVLLVRSLLARGDEPNAARELQPLVARYANSSTVQNLVGAVRLTKHDGTGARQAFERAFALDATNMEALTSLTSLDVAGRRINDASARLDRALERAPQDSGLLILRARVYEIAGSRDKAADALERAAQADADSFTPFVMLSQIYVSQHRFGEAEAKLRHVVARRPNSPGAHVLLAMIEELNGHRGDAVQEYERALAIDANSAVAANNLAWLYLETNQHLDTAFELARVAKAKLPDDPTVNDTLGWAYYRRGLYAEAIDALELSVRGNPRNATAAVHLGLSYFESGRWPEARESLQRALRQNPGVAHSDEARQALDAIGR